MNIIKFCVPQCSWQAWGIEGNWSLHMCISLTNWLLTFVLANFWERGIMGFLALYWKGEVSCAALACFLHHTGLAHFASSCRDRPNKDLLTVYRAVFGLRKEIFNRRPVPDAEGKMDEKRVKEFADSCNGVCHYLFFFLCVINRAIPNETEPIVPQISSVSASTDRQTSVDMLRRSPGSTLRKGPLADADRSSLLRLLSHPTDMDPSIQPDEVCVCVCVWISRRSICCTCCVK